LEKYIKANPQDVNSKKSIEDFITRLKTEKNSVVSQNSSENNNTNKPSEYKSTLTYKSETSLQSNIDEINVQLANR